MKSLKEIQIYSYLDYGVVENTDAYYGEEIGLTFTFGFVGEKGAFT